MDEINESQLVTLALVSVYSPPHEELLRQSWSTLWSCTYSGDSNLHVLEVQKISALVAMIPHQPFNDLPHMDRYFLVEKPGLDTVHLGGGLDSPF